MTVKLRPFQREFLAAYRSGKYDTLAFSAPRGSGKSWLAARVLADFLLEGERGKEAVLLAGSIEQARVCFRFVQAMLADVSGLRVLDSATRCALTNTERGTRVRVAGSNAKTAFGLAGVPLVVADEPGAWEVNGGGLMYDAIQTAQGKPGSPLRVIYCGTLAPARSGWWHDLVDRGTHGRTYVQVLQGKRATWDQWPTIRKANPLSFDADLRRTLLMERDEAEADSRLKARFLSYRLNLPTADESVQLLTADEAERWFDRPAPPRAGRPMVGIDIGGGRAWDAAVAIWQNGRVEALAVAPGVPDLSDQERRDRVPRGTYQELESAGVLDVADGVHDPPVTMLWSAIVDRWGQPVSVIADRFRYTQLVDIVQAPLSKRITRWSESTEDIDHTRRIVRDGPAAMAEADRLLMAVSMLAAEVKNDDAGSVRLVKKGTNNTGRDDVVAALILVMGAYGRAMARPAVRTLSYGIV